MERIPGTDGLVIGKLARKTTLYRPGAMLALITEAVNDGLTGGVSTSADIETLRADMQTNTARLETRIAEQETRLTNQMWKIALVGVALVGAMIAFAPKFFSG